MSTSAGQPSTSSASARSSSQSTVSRATGPSRLPSETTRSEASSSRPADTTIARASSPSTSSLPSPPPSPPSNGPASRQSDSTSASFASNVASSVESQAALTQSGLPTGPLIQSLPTTVVDSTSWVHVSHSSPLPLSSSTAISSAQASNDRSNMSLRITIGVIASFFVLFFLLLCIKPCRCFKRKDRYSSDHPKAPVPGGLGWNARKSTATGSWDTWEKFGDEKEVDAREIVSIKRDSRRMSMRDSRRTSRRESMRSVYTTNTVPAGAGYYNSFGAPGAPPLPMLPPSVWFASNRDLC